MKSLLILIVTAWSVLSAFPQNSPPSITYIASSFDEASKQITVNFNLSDNESDDVEISVQLSVNWGETFWAEVINLQGDKGFPVTPGSGKQVTFNYDASLQPVPGWIVKIIADDRHPADIQGMVNKVDSNRLRSTVTFMEGVRHYQTGIGHLEDVRNFIELELRTRNMFVYREDFHIQNDSAGANIISCYPGVNDGDSTTYIVDAHFDSVEDSPGADDNASGIAGVIEAARILSQYPLKKNLRFIAFDFEESTPVIGLLGSTKYVAEGIKSYEKVAGVFNFEMIGYYSEEPNSQGVPASFDIFYPDQYSMVSSDSFRGNFIVNTANTTSASLGVAFDNASAQYVPALKVVSFALPDAYLTQTADFWRSDHASFWLGSKKAIMLTDGANFRNHSYHTPNDTIGALNFTFMSNVVKATIATVATLAQPVHGSAAMAFLFTTGIENTPSTCDWGMAQSESAIMFYPNKDCDAQRWSITFFDTQGRMIYQTLSEKDESLKIETSRWSPGLYFFVANSGARKTSRPVLVR